MPEISAERKALIEAVLAGKKLQQLVFRAPKTPDKLWSGIYSDNPVALLSYVASADPEHLRVAPDPVVRWHPILCWGTGRTRILGGWISCEAACDRSKFDTQEWNPHMDSLVGVLRVEYDPDTFDTRDRLPVVLKAEVLPPPTKETE